MKKSKPTTASNSDNEVIDFINNLPDPILQLILSGLPNTEEAVRTSILSTRWRYLWTSLPSLDIDCTRSLKPSSNFQTIEFKEFVNRVLVDKTVDLDSFRLRCDNHFDMSTVRRWIHAAVMRKVKSLDLSFCPKVDEEVMELPHSLVTCDTLEILRLFLYKRSLSLPNVTGFPALRVLQLNSIRLPNQDSVEGFLKGCLLLEDLSIVDCHFFSFGGLRISCLNLKTLKIHNSTIVEVDLDDDGFYFEYDRLGDNLYITCPKLVYFEYKGPMAHKFLFENIDSLKKAVIYPSSVFRSLLSSKDIGDIICGLFAQVSHVESLSLNLFFIKAISAACDSNGDFPASLPNLKTLEISTTIDECNMNVVIRILRCSPNLESFNLIIHKETFRPDEWELKFDKVLARHLKRVEFLEVNGEKRKLDLARFLLQHGNELEEMAFTWRRNDYHPENSGKTLKLKSMKTMKEVWKFYKASSTVKVFGCVKGGFL